MTSQLHKGDIVRCVAGEYCNHLAKVKKVDRHQMVHLDLDKSEKKINPLTGRAFTPKTPVICVVLVQERLISYD
jgi:hypothetical protein